MKENGITILVVDDEKDMVENIKRILSKEGYRIITSTDSYRASEIVERERPNIIVTDMRMPGLNGMELMEWIRGSGYSIPVIMITAYASIDLAVEAIKKGATDFLAKPFSREDLLKKIDKAIQMEKVKWEEKSITGKIKDDDDHVRIIGEHPALKRALNLAFKTGPTDSRVLLIGESGTGKDLIAMLIHQLSPRRDQPFIAVNCAAFSESLLESELFGHEKGAFTGAAEAKKGIFEVSNGGTLFLDEITEASKAFQTKLLRVVEKGEFFRVGGTKPRNINVRIISATNKDIHVAVNRGEFREDLYYRLSVVTIYLPPLRERRDDIPLLARHFMEIHSGRQGKEIIGIHPDALNAMRSYHWPGNIRELENVIERAVILAEDGGEITVEHLLFPTQGLTPKARDYKEEMTKAERDMIIEALKECNWNRSRAARRLGIGRRTLYDKLARLGITLKPGH
jgi:DNA-binding NtrC family response regulator